MTGGQTGEPTLADVQAQYPAWQCARGNNDLFYAQHTTTGQQVTGEDPLDLRDQIKAAQARHAYSHLTTHIGAAMDLSASPGARFSNSGPPRIPARQPTAGRPETSQRQGGPKAALEALDAELDRHHYATTLSGDDGDIAWLTIASRHADLSEDVYCDGRFYYWSWRQPIAAAGDPRAAAGKISYVLGGPGNPHA